MQIADAPPTVPPTVKVGEHRTTEFLTSEGSWCPAFDGRPFGQQVLTDAYEIGRWADDGGNNPD